MSNEFYGKSWGDVFRDATESAGDQPETESEDDAVEFNEIEEDESEEVEADEVEADEDQPETESEDDTPEVVEDPEYELGDGKKKVKLSELKEGFMRTSDYTKKTQELASQRKEVEAQTEKLKPVQDWLTHMEDNPWLWGQINQAIEEFNRSEVLPLQEVLQDAQYGAYVNRLTADNNRLKRELDSVKGEYEGVKLNTEFSKLKGELSTDYGDLVTPEYMQSLQDRAKKEKLSTSTLKEIAEGHLAKEKLKSQSTNVKKETKKAEAKAVQSLAETRRNAPSRPKPAAQAPAKTDVVRNEGWKEFFKSLSGE